MLSTLGLIFSNLPELIALVKKAIEAIQGIASSVERKQHLAEMTRALGTASSTKDTTDLENIFKGGKP